MGRKNGWVRWRRSESETGRKSKIKQRCNVFFLAQGNYDESSVAVGVIVGAPGVGVHGNWG